jgi:hypothetical protein
VAGTSARSVNRDRRRCVAGRVLIPHRSHTSRPLNPGSPDQR